MSHDVGDRRVRMPDIFYRRKEYNRIAAKTALGFAMMGSIGFLVKLIFIPVNQVTLPPCLR